MNQSSQTTTIVATFVSFDYIEPRKVREEQRTSKVVETLDLTLWGGHQMCLALTAGLSVLITWK